MNTEPLPDSHRIEGKPEGYTYNRMIEMFQHYIFCFWRQTVHDAQLEVFQHFGKSTKDYHKWLNDKYSKEKA